MAGHASARVSFTAPGDPGSSAITGYTVTATDTTDPNAVVAPATAANGPDQGDRADDRTRLHLLGQGGQRRRPRVRLGAVQRRDRPRRRDDDQPRRYRQPAAAGESVTFTATVSPAPDGGDVAFEVDGTPLTGCTANAVHSVGGQAMCETSSLSAGAHSVVAVYGGDDFSAGSESAPLAQSVVAPGPTPCPASPHRRLTDAPRCGGAGAVSVRPGHQGRPRGSSAAPRAPAGRCRSPSASSRRARSAGDWTSASTCRSGGRPARRPPQADQARDPADLTTAAPDTISKTIRLGARARAALKRHPAPIWCCAPPCACRTAVPSTPPRRSPGPAAELSAARQSRAMAAAR